MYRIKSNGVVIHDQLLAQDVFDKFDNGYIKTDAHISIERLDTVTLKWENVPMSKFFARTTGI